MSDEPVGFVRQISAAQSRANALNARRSTGPRTLDGKARTSLNALTTGLRAKSVAISDEEEERRQQLLRGAMEYFQPVGVVEMALVERAVDCLCRQPRAAQYEAAMLRVARDPPAGLKSLAESARRELTSAENAVSSLRDTGAPDAVIDGETVSVVLDAVADAIGMSTADAAFQSMVPVEPWSNSQLVAFVEAAAAAAGVPIPQMLHDAGELAEFRRHQAHATLDAANEAIAKHRDTHMLLNADVVERVARYEAHVDRCLRRALDELAKLQGRRAVVPGRRAAG